MTTQIQAPLDPPAGAPRGRIALVLVGVVALQALFALSYLGAFHDPAPHGLAVAVAGPSAQVAERAAAALRKSGAALDPRVVTSPADARAQVTGRDAVAAFIVGAAGDRLLVASAAGPGQAALLTTRFQASEAAQKRTLAVEDVAALPQRDSRGLGPFYLTLVMVFGGYLGVVVLGLLAAPSAHRGRAAALRLAAMTGYALVSAIVVVLATRVAFGIFSGRELAAIAAAALICLATSTVAISLQALLGVPGTGAVLLLFVIAGNPASGGAVPYGLLPEPYRTGGQFLVNGAGVDLVRNLTYFDGHAIGRPLGVLAAWAIAGSAVAVGLGARRFRRLSAAEAELIPAVAAGL